MKDLSLLVFGSLGLLVLALLLGGPGGPAVLIGGVLFLAVYLFPSLIARRRRHRHTLAIFWLNVLLGFSVLGWVGALVWALVGEQRPVAATV